MQPGSRVPSLIHAREEMADQTRSFDWSATSVGPIAAWPAALLSTVNLLLDSPDPMVLCWTEDKIPFYNDAFLESLGRAENGLPPSAPGGEASLCWGESWDVVSPLIEEVFRTGESVQRKISLLLFTGMECRWRPGGRFPLVRFAERKGYRKVF